MHARATHDCPRYPRSVCAIRRPCLEDSMMSVKTLYYQLVIGQIPLDMETTQIVKYYLFVLGEIYCKIFKYAQAISNKTQDKRRLRRTLTLASCRSLSGLSMRSGHAAFAPRHILQKLHQIDEPLHLSPAEMDVLLDSRRRWGLCNFLFHH